jgi:hypothetical protein
MSEIQKLKYNIYQISEAIRDVIENDINEETGEIEYDVSDKLETMQIAKEELTKNVILYYKETKAFQDSVKAEKKRLSDMDSQISSRLDKLKLFLSKQFEPGTKIKTEQFEIGWCKSSSVDFDAEWFAKKYGFGLDSMTEKEYLENLDKIAPGLVKIDYSLIKSEANKLYKDTKTLPEGLVFNEKQNLQIK